jgi:hypothetical protein
MLEILSYSVNVVAGPGEWSKQIPRKVEVGRKRKRKRCERVRRKKMRKREQKEKRGGRCFYKG